MTGADEIIREWEEDADSEYTNNLVKSEAIGYAMALDWVMGNIVQHNSIIVSIKREAIDREKQKLINAGLITGA